MNNPWILTGAGILFCASGAYLFYKNIFEEDKSIRRPIFLMILGIILIILGTAGFLDKR